MGEHMPLRRITDYTFSIQRTCNHVSKQA